MQAARIPRRIHVVVGKGGVGKSTVAAAIARAGTAAGRRVLALEIGRPDGLARALAVEASENAGDVVPVAGAPGTSYAWLEGGAALATYLAFRIPSRTLRRRLSHSRLYRYFVAAAPGLDALMVMGQIRHLYRETRGGRPTWDLVVVDAGASGRSMDLLAMPRVAAHTFTSGLVHTEAVDVTDYFEDPERTRVHVVALPEEMPLVEAAEIVARLRGELAMPIGSVLVNACRPKAPAGFDDAVARLEGRAAHTSGRGLMSAVAIAGRRAIAWRAIQEAEIALFETRTGIFVRRLPRVVAERLGPAELSRIADVIAPVLGAAPPARPVRPEARA